MIIDLNEIGKNLKAFAETLKWQRDELRKSFETGFIRNIIEEEECLLDSANSAKDHLESICLGLSTAIFNYENGGQSLEDFKDTVNDLYSDIDNAIDTLSGYV